eukprot:13686916-Alexandrium_andersonii.AAC.1
MVATPQAKLDNSMTIVGMTPITTMFMECPLPCTAHPKHPATMTIVKFRTIAGKPAAWEPVLESGAHATHYPLMVLKCCVG